MSTLSGQTIQSTYQGLLKLDNSTTGITQSLQSVQDGLGNNTGLRLAQNQLESPNIQSYISLKGRYYGAGFTQTAAQQMAAGTQNIMIAYPFYDSGQYSYSALSYNVITATSTSDSVELAFYTGQMTSNGLYPHQVVSSGITLTGLTTTGIKDLTLASNISFSGYGGGVFFIVYKVSNGGVQPTIRFGPSSASVLVTSIPILGFSKSIAINAYQFLTPVNSGLQSLVLTGETSFVNPYPVTITNSQSTSTTINGSNLGFLLHTTNF